MKNLTFNICDEYNIVSFFGENSVVEHVYVSANNMLTKKQSTHKHMNNHEQDNMLPTFYIIFI